MTVFRFGLAAALMVAGPVLAQDEEVRYSDAPTMDCLAQADTSETMHSCIGLSAAACMNASQYGSTTVGMSECTGRETAFWDGRLNTAYKAMMERARKADAMNEDDPRVIYKIADSLRDMQRAWISYRDATCSFAYATGMGGTIAQTYTSDCRLNLTAEQYIYLDSAWPSY